MHLQVPGSKATDLPNKVHWETPVQKSVHFKRGYRKLKYDQKQEKIKEQAYICSEDYKSEDSLAIVKKKLKLLS